MPQLTILNSTEADLELIFEFYSNATEYQKPRFESVWPEFSREMVRKEIQEQRQFKLLMNNQVACVWAVAFSDPEIWGELNNAPAIYIHRIAVHKNFRGLQLVTKLVSWAKEYAGKHQKDFIRMDTVGENKKLIAHYKKCGFAYLGLKKLTETTNLPAHYHNATVSLFEIDLKTN